MNLNYLKKAIRLVVAGLLLLITTLNPGTISASELQAFQMSVHLENATLKELFDIIEEKFEYSFLIRNNDIDLEERITMKITDKSVEEILTKALKKQEAEFTVNDNRIVVYKTNSKKTANPAPAEIKASQQTTKISGTVIDEFTGEPVIGANVLVKGTAIGTITDYDGNFSFEAPAGSTLVISYIGYLNVEVAASSSPMTIRIKEDTHALEEVVVVGYGVQKKESLTGAMQVVSSDKLQDMTSASVSNMLQAKAPGVHIQSGGSKPGEEGQIVIRGKSTINGTTAPLWVIDGVVAGTEAGLINPNDIESISILKDAASTAIYGSSGANGVIMVTTKQGKTGDAKIQVSAKWAATKLTKGNMEMTNGAELYEYYQQYTNQEAIKFAQYTPELANRNFDWWDAGSKTGLAQDYNISISGGTEKMKSAISVGVYDETAAVKGYDYTRYTLRYNMEYKANSWLTIRPKIAGSRVDTDDRMFNTGAMYTNLPWDSPYDENGDLIQEYRPKNWIASDKYNYLYDLQWNYKKQTNYEASANMDFDIKLTDWLTFASVNSFRLSTRKSKQYWDPKSYDGQSVNGIIEDFNRTYTRLYTNQLLRFNKTFDKHSINGVLGYEWNESQVEEFTQSVINLPSGFEIGSAGSTPRSVAGTKTESAVQSYLFNANYSYDHRYLAGFSFRRDGASNFGDNAKYGNFFSVSAGWNIHNEEFFEVDWAQQLKIRGSYGSVGMPPKEFYPQYGLYALSVSNVNRSYNGVPGAIMNQLPNHDLTWEKTTTAGLGIDAILFDRLTFNFDVYYKKTTDLLYPVPQPGVIGLDQYWQNVGQVDNKGLEVAASYAIIKNKEMQWNIGANLALNRNKIAKLYGGQPIIRARGGANILGVLDKIMTEGSDIDTWYGAEWAGVDPETGAAQWWYTTNEGKREKTTVYADAKQTESLAELGRSTPDFYGGFSTDFSWKNLTVGATFGYSVGGKIYNYTRSVYDSDGAYTTYNQVKMRKGWKRWEKPGDIATHPIAIYGNKTQSNSASSRYLEDASYLRLRNLSISYLLPWKIPYVNAVNLSLSGENLFVITDFSGSDPEVPPSDDSGKNGAYSSTYPRTRNFLFGINITL